MWGMAKTLHTGKTTTDIDGNEVAVWTHAPRQTTRLYDFNGYTFYCSTGPFFAVEQ